MSENSRLGLLHLMEQRLKRQPPPTKEELRGIKKLVLDHARHPALGALSPELRGSATTNSATSTSQPTTVRQSAEPSGKMNHDSAETEQDGIRVESLRRSKVRRLLPAQPGRTPGSSK